MAGKKKDKEAKKARAAEKNAKAQAKSAQKNKKMAKKQGDEEEDVDIDAILENYKKQQEEFNAVTITVCNSPPSKRLNPSLSYSPIAQKKEIYLFGGEAEVNGLAEFYNDLFVYSPDSDIWRKVQSPNSPLPRSSHSMCVHPSGVMLLFGGEFSSPKQNTFYHYGDTWTLDPATKEWTKIENKKSPSARSGHRMTVWKNYILLHGGFRDLSSTTTYLHDLWAFDVTSYKWHQIEFPPNHVVPDARSGHSLVPHPEGAVIYGGYSKVKAPRNTFKGKVHQDLWLLKMKGDLQGVRWERRKKAPFGPSARVGCSMVYHKGRGLLFGGVYDHQETEETLSSDFYNQLYAYQIELNKWFCLNLRKKKVAKQERIIKKERDADLQETLDAILKEKLSVNEESESSNTLDTSTIPDNSSPAEEQPENIKEYQIVQAVQPRFNAATCVLDDTLYIFGGAFEKGEREFNLDSMYAVDLGRLDGYKVLWEDLRELEEAEQEEESEDDDDDDEFDDDGEEEQEDFAYENDEESEEEEEEVYTIEDPRPWLPHPKPFETLRNFYLRAGNDFTDWSLKAHPHARGKELKTYAFELCEDRWWERREEVRISEDKFEEMGGVAEVVEKDANSRKGRR